MEGAWEDFGQKIELSARIREILLNYPEGTSILKEFVQNAGMWTACTCFLSWELPINFLYLHGFYRWVL